MQSYGQTSMIQDRLDAAQRAGEAAESGTPPISYAARLAAANDLAMQQARELEALDRLRRLPFGTLRRRTGRF